MKTTLKLWLLLIINSYLIPVSFAYEIGELKVLSAVNEPFEGRISLYNHSEESKLPIIVDIASKVEYMRHKVKRNYYVADLKVSIEKDALDTSYLRVHSREPIRARSLEFLIMMITSKEESFAKYRFVLPQIANGDIVMVPNQLLPREKQVLFAKAFSDKDKTKSQIKEKQNNYKVVSGDSISKIAMRLVKHYPQFKSWRSLMHRLIELNPNAFRHNNINHLKVASILRLPLPVKLNKNQLLASSSDISQKIKNNKIAHYKKIKQASSQSHIDKNIKQKISVEGTLPYLLSKVKKQNRTKKQQGFKKQSVLGYKTLNEMKIQDSNSVSYQAQALFRNDG
ncbi:MAG: hypothetical protein PUP46_02055 [Endozoicomonas sp. (ex Botrylloides leachii)]|nr:hypothetical protein [Endozoicomonas sp. (ex Botrylloides leachii)]